ncbi:rod shape-determining protein MreD [Novosphingobium sp.]|uniref:rod shape-determining protein MreD n=1 Tax=Novosphingobium sp. TaxID=1874826 RepID=UPI003D0CDD93
MALSSISTASTALATGRDATPNRPINRAPMPWLATGLPWVSIMLASTLTFSPIIASAPVMPPIAFMALLAWRMLRPGFLPIWAGLPLGAWDDLYSGQPFGSAIVLWSLAMLAMDLVDERFLWRSFMQDWLAAIVLMALYVLLASGIAGIAARYPLPLTIGPQLLISIVSFPVVNRLVALLDRVRLVPIRRL